MRRDIYPTTEEIRRWLTEVLQHTMRIEYYLGELRIGQSDIQRPHDMVGEGNKLEWTCIRGFALQYRGPEFFEDYVLPALHHHRRQHHHHAWNVFNPGASADSMMLGAVDACCSMLEKRDYQGGEHTWEQIRAAAYKNPIHKTPWMLLVAAEMEKVSRVCLDDMTLHQIPRGILNPEMREKICRRIDKTIGMLKQDHGIDLL